MDSKFISSKYKEEKRNRKRAVHVHQETFFEASELTY